MDQNSLIIASCITVTFLLSKYIDRKFIQKQELEIKQLIRDLILVYISSIFGIFIIDQVNTKIDIKPSTSAFINTPEF
ncbi:hypothetical protein N9O88_01265 [bacterium]|nr:hypothetical protein [bacterium]